MFTEVLPQLAAASVGSSVLFGLVNSLHCIGMCGPLTLCCTSSAAAAFAYHGGRIVAYTVAGIGLGALGAGFSDGSGKAWVLVVSPYLAFALALMLLLSAFNVGHGLQVRMPGLIQQAFRRVGRLSPVPRALSIGLLTALLPCGLLFAVYALALTSGSVHAGGLTLLGFALGSLPLLAVAQWRFQDLRARLGVHRMASLQRAMFVLASVMLVWRGVLDLGSSSCCH